MLSSEVIYKGVMSYTRKQGYLLGRSKSLTENEVIYLQVRSKVRIWSLCSLS